MPSATQSRLLTDEEKLVVDRYNAGAPLAEIAADLSNGKIVVTANQISATVTRLREAGFDLPLRRPRGAAGKAQAGYSHKDDDTVIAMYLDGAGNVAIAAALERTYGSVSTRIMTLKREGRVPEKRPPPKAAHPVKPSAPEAEPPSAAPAATILHPIAPQPPTPPTADLVLIAESATPAPAAPVARAARPPRPLPDGRFAALLLHVDGNRPGAGRHPLSVGEGAALTARPDLVRAVGEGRYRLTPEGRRWARAHDTRPDTNPVANRLYWLLYRIAGLDHASALDAARRGGLDVSRSRIDGWGKHPTDRRHAAMTLDELEALMGGILDMDKEEDGRS